MLLQYLNAHVVLSCAFNVTICTVNKILLQLPVIYQNMRSIYSILLTYSKTKYILMEFKGSQLMLICALI